MNRVYEHKHLGNLMSSHLYIVTHPSMHIRPHMNVRVSVYLHVRICSFGDRTSQRGGKDDAAGFYAIGSLLSTVSNSHHVGIHTKDTQHRLRRDTGLQLWAEVNVDGYVRVYGVLSATGTQRRLAREGRPACVDRGCKKDVQRDFSRKKKRSRNWIDINMQLVGCGQNSDFDGCVYTLEIHITCLP